MESPEDIVVELSPGALGTFRAATTRPFFNPGSSEMDIGEYSEILETHMHPYGNEVLVIAMCYLTRAYEADYTFFLHSSTVHLSFAVAYSLAAKYHIDIGGNSASHGLPNSRWCRLVFLHPWKWSC